ncbi:MAG: VWA domain-containing protein, partial [Planctomycetaceae bacterium]|nr:VWA domain-containing protein [Planctomycetaceae bacterium]
MPNTVDQQALDSLLSCQAPLLIGVRHHSAALARAMPRLLEAYQPEVILVELPMEFAGWLPWLGDAELTAPVALAGCSESQDDLSFYPFADFSPELAAIRWAFKNDVSIEPCDLPIAEATVSRRSREHRECEPNGLLDRIFHRTQTRDVGTLWERLIETPASTASPESLRRSGLLFGYALRCNDQTAARFDRLREAHMRKRIAEKSKKCAVVVGAYHAPALLPEPVLWSMPEEDKIETKPASGKISTALIPYSFDQLDERSGYPAGIRDPLWHQRAFETVQLDDWDQTVADLVVGVCRELREQGHPMNAADGKEVLRMARDLATLRNFPAPGRGELIEAIQSCLARGEVMGIGRAVARAMEEILIGSRKGSLPSKAPRSGLGPHLDSVFETLNLPREEKRLRLDPLRSRLDRARVVTLERLIAAGIPYGKPAETEDLAHRENLTEVWDLKWTHATAAMIELSAARGATLPQVATGALLEAGLNVPQEDWTAEQLGPLMQAARCGLGDLVRSGLGWLMGPFLLTAKLSELTLAMEFVERLRSGHIPGLPTEESQTYPPIVESFEVPRTVQTLPLLQAAIASLEGLVGSEDMQDASAILDLVLWYQQQADQGPSVDAGRLVWSLKLLAEEGSPLMQGAGMAALLLLDVLDSDTFGCRFGSWIDGAVDGESRKDLGARVQGAVYLVLPRLSSDLSCLDEPEQRIAGETDQEFLSRLPALRSGFQVLSPAARDRLLKELLARLPEDDSPALPQTLDPEISAARFEADEVGRQAVSELLSDLSWEDSLQPALTEEPKALRVQPGQQLSLPNRWRLILASQPENLPPMAARAAKALDELYGQGQGEGARGRSGGGAGAGQEDAYPGTREWAEDLGELFGEAVREEVLGEAVAAGRAGAFALLESEPVKPSIELLEQALSLKGSLPESQMEKLRGFVRKIVDQLVRELSTKLRPALTGLSTPRPTSRKTPRLDLNRTVRANLHTARKDSKGQIHLVPERFLFRSLSKRSMDWHVIFVVDVSGSMEPSVIYSAMMAAIFSGLPAI